MRAWRGAVGVVAVSALAALAAAAPSVAAPSVAAPSVAALPTLRPVVLPRDHGAHPAFQVEWWYTAGTVEDRAGRSYFWFATVWAGDGYLLAKVNVVDLRADRVVLSKEYVASGALAPGQTRMHVGGFALGLTPRGAWAIDAPAPGAGRLVLALTPVQPYVLNGPRGIVAEGPGATSAYYSAPRLAATGTLTLAGRARHLTGQGWFDHQWGNFATNSASWHWNWFACQFDDGADLMLYQFITPSGQPTGVQSGTFVPVHGAPAHPHRYTVVPLGPSIHPAGATGTYPLRWRLDIPSAHLDVTLAARARHQFIANEFIPGFWEGAAAITRGTAGACIVESTRETAGLL